MAFSRLFSKLIKGTPPVFPLRNPGFTKPTLVSRNMSSKSKIVNIILPKNNEDIPRFQTIEPDSPDRKWKCLSKKRLKEKRMREKKKRREMNKRDPRKVIVPKGMRKKGKNKFANAGERIKYRIEKAKIKEAMLIKKLEKYEVAKLQGPMPKPENLTGEERFYMQKMGQKKSNYVPVGRRGVFGGVILNMHLHWKKHETVKVICKPCKPGQVHEYAKEIARLSGGEPIQIIGNDTILFYRGKDYVQPQVLSPIDTLSKKKALEKSKYEQSLESVRNLITVSEKELELYYRHVALYGDHKPSTSDLVHGDKEDKQSCAFPQTTSYQASLIINFDKTIQNSMKFKAFFTQDGIILLNKRFLPALDKIGRTCHLLLTPTHAIFLHNLIHNDGVQSIAQFSKDFLFKDYKISSNCENRIAFLVDVSLIQRAIHSALTVAEDDGIQMKLVKKLPVGSSVAAPYLSFETKGVRSAVVQDVPISKPLGRAEVNELQDALDGAQDLPPTLVQVPDLAQLQNLVDRLKNVGDMLTVAITQYGDLHLQVSTTLITVGSEFRKLRVLGVRADAPPGDQNLSAPVRTDMAIQRGEALSVQVGIKHLVKSLQCHVAKPDCAFYGITPNGTSLTMIFQFFIPGTRVTNKSLSFHCRLPVLDPGSN